MGEILIIGSSGSMGRRYQAILKYLRKPYLCYDTAHTFLTEETLESMASKASAFIVCTPTDTHIEILLRLVSWKKPVLCEKPIAKSLREVREIFDLYSTWGTPLDMVMQYEHISNVMPSGHYDILHSHYNYFKTGGDGLYWDCLQIIGLHSGSWQNLKIDNDSPIWDCSINNMRVDIKSMDMAYIDTVKYFLNEKYRAPSKNINYHLKVKDFMKYREKFIEA